MIPPKPKDRRAITSPQNAKRAGRKRIVKDGRVYSLSVPADLHEWLRERGPEDVRQALERWRIETLIV